MTIAGASSQNGTIAYEYDAVGNRKSLTSTVPAIPTGLMYYDANDTISTDQYDNNGNTVSSGGVVNVYDFENHLIQHGGITYGYDGDGNRVTKTVAGVTTKYIVTDANPTGYAQVLEEWTGSNYIPYTFGLTLLAQFNSSNPSKQKFYGYDGHGSVRYITNTSGTVTDTYDYDAFGNLLSRTGTTYNNYMFAGEQFDPDLGLYYNRARYLDIRTGRFWGMDTQPGDPESPLSLHRYLYAAMDPVNNIDPGGNESLLDVSLSLAINTTLEAMPYSAVFRAGQMLYRVAHGTDLSEAAQGAALGFLEDASFTFLSAGLLRYAVGTLPLRPVGTTLVRAADSIWNIAGWSARGEAVEGFVFKNILGRARQLPWNFPVLDDFTEGVATSIKSVDLTAAGYQNAPTLLSTLSDAAGNLAEFAGRRWGGAVVDATQIQERVLIVAIEDGAATLEQEMALKQFLQNYKTIWPNIKVALETIR